MNEKLYSKHELENIFEGAGYRALFLDYILGFLRGLESSENLGNIPLAGSVMGGGGTSATRRYNKKLMYRNIFPGFVAANFQIMHYGSLCYVTR
jgi:hypothetical protein